MAHLQINAGDAGRRVALSDPTVLGRGNQADLILGENTLSRTHARFYRRSGQWRLEDLSSSNGSFIRGERVTDTALCNGDELRFGALKATFIDDQPAAISMRDTDDEAAGQVLDNLAAGEHLAPLMPEGLDQRTGEMFMQRLSLLSDVATMLANVVSERELFPRVLECLLEAFPQAEHGCAMLVDDGHLQPVLALASNGEAAEVTVSRSLARQVMVTRSAVLSADTADDERFDPGHTVHRIGLRTVMCAPLISEDAVLGIMQLDSCDPRSHFSRADMAVFLGIAGHAAMALSKARLHASLLEQRLMQKDLELAERIQQCFLPRQAPSLPGYTLADCYQSAQQVGGDYYHYLKMRSRAIGLTLGDVSGKGVPAALYMARLSSEMRYHALACEGPGKILSALNDALAEEMETGMFVTLVLMALLPETGELVISNAGHPPPLRRDRHGRVTALEAAGNIPLGMSAGLSYGQTSFQLEQGDWVLLYTDGITEAMNDRDEEFGMERLEQLLAKGGDSPQVLLDTLAEAVAEHASGRAQSDDLTLMCLGVN